MGTVLALGACTKLTQATIAGVWECDDQATYGFERDGSFWMRTLGNPMASAPVAMADSLIEGRFKLEGETLTARFSSQTLSFPYSQIGLAGQLVAFGGFQQVGPTAVRKASRMATVSTLESKGANRMTMRIQQVFDSQGRDTSVKDRHPKPQECSRKATSSAADTQKAPDVPEAASPAAPPGSSTSNAQAWHDAMVKSIDEENRRAAAEVARQGSNAQGN